MDEIESDLEAWGATEEMREAVRKRTDPVVNVEWPNWPAIVVFQQCEITRHLVGLSTLSAARVNFYLSGLPALEVESVCRALAATPLEHLAPLTKAPEYNALLLGDVRTMAAAFAEVHNSRAN